MERLNKYIDSLKEEVKQCLVDCGGCCILISNDGKCECENANKICFFEQLKSYKEAEEQGLLLRLPIAVNDVVDKLFSHNELISLWREVKEDTTYHKRIWYGMAWDVPSELKGCKFVKVFGTIPESIAHADIINIEVILDEEAEAALEKMKGEEHE